MKKKIFILLTIILVSIVSANMEITEGLNYSGLDYKNQNLTDVKSALTIADLDWESGSFDMYDYNWSKEFNPIITGTYGFDRTSTVLHAYEISGTFRHYVGWYANFTVLGEFFSLSFLQKTKANHLDAVRNFIHVFDLNTNLLLHRVDSKGNGFGIYEEATLETDYLFYNYTFSTRGANKVILFLGFYDSWVADWQQETWIKEIEIVKGIDSSSFDTTFFEKHISSPIAEPQELLWIDNTIFCVGMNIEDNTKNVIEINPLTHEVDKYHQLNEIDVNFPACALTYDGNNFWTIKNNGYGLTLILQKYNINFDLVSSISMSISAPANAIGYGLTYDGEHLWMSDPHTDLLYQINRTNAEIIRSIPSTGTSPRGLEYHEGYLWVVESSENKIHKISSADGSILESHPTHCEYPWGITIDDSKTIWISSRASPFIYKTKNYTTPKVEETFTDLPVFFLSLATFVFILSKRKRLRKN